MIRINLGCGKDIKDINDGWINVDIADYGDKRIVIADLTKTFPWEDNSVDEVLMDNFLEHIPRERYLWFLDEIYRVCKHGAKITIYVPHYTGLGAFTHPVHYNYYGVSSFDTMNVDMHGGFERYNKARFKVKSTLLFFHHNYYNLHFLSNLNSYITWLWNFSFNWQHIMERICPWGFDEIKFVLTVIKDETGNKG